MEGEIIIVQELANEGNLSSFLKKNGPLSLFNLKKLLIDISSALSFGHKQGLFHLDIKVENIFVFSDDKGNLVFKISDFGGSIINEIKNEQSE